MDALWARLSRAEVDARRLRDATHRLLEPIRFSQVFNEYTKYRSRAERSTREASYYRGLYHGVVPTE